jgi:CTP synthase
MRLGSYPCVIVDNTKAEEIYHEKNITERHRHRYEFNNKYLEEYKTAGMIPVGINPKDNLVEMVEIPDHPWFIGVQFHPEYKSTVLNPHPVFINFVNAAKEYHKKVSNK